MSIVVIKKEMYIVVIFLFLHISSLSSSQKSTLWKSNFNVAPNPFFYSNDSSQTLVWI